MEFFAKSTELTIFVASRVCGDLNEENAFTMRTLRELRRIVEEGLSKLAYPEKPWGLYEPIVYTLQSGGKRIRPVLVLATYDWLTGGEQPLDPILPAALAVEVYHNFTLLHDDIMDHSDLRRGKPTVVAKWGVNGAILSGDAMMILAYQILCGVKSEQFPGILDRFGWLAMSVCQGQQLDMEYEGRNDITLPTYLEMVEGKTAALLQGAVRIGAYAAKANPEVEAGLDQFAHDFGIAFQLQDDLLDVYGNTATFGKRVGDDIAVGKNTYLSVLAFEHAAQPQREALEHLRDKAAYLDTEAKVEQTVAIYNAAGVEPLAEKGIEQYLNAAGSHLATVEKRIGAPAQALRELLASQIGRTF